MKKTYIIGSIAIAIIATASIFFACNKEEKEQIKSNEGNVIPKILGTLVNDPQTNSLTIVPNFDIEKNIVKLQQELNKSQKSNEVIFVENIGFYVYEDDDEVSPFLQIGLYNENENKFENIFFDLQLIETPEKSNLKRYGFVDDIQYSCTCTPDAYCNEGAQPEERGCYPTRYGSRWACSPCPSRRGSCRESITATVIVESITRYFSSAVSF